jgi:hypothetical protein
MHFPFSFGKNIIFGYVYCFVHSVQTCGIWFPYTKFIFTRR